MNRFEILKTIRSLIESGRMDGVSIRWSMRVFNLQAENFRLSGKDILYDYFDGMRWWECLFLSLSHDVFLERVFREIRKKVHDRNLF